MSTPIRWGILGAGNIAHKLAEAVNIDPDSQLVAVASNTAGKAEQFVQQHGGDIQPCSQYSDLVCRNDIDVVYVATTHNLHYENAMLALEHNKHVLVEKPFTVNAREAQALFDEARKRQRFIMEALWVRFLPSMVHLRTLLQDGAIGDIRYFNLSFGVVLKPMYAPRLKDPNLAGGVTLDMGIYPISFANFMHGSLPVDVNAMWKPSLTGVDEHAIYQFKYADGCLASIATSYSLKTKVEAMIYGSQGYVEFPGFQQGNQFHIHQHNGSNEILASETIRNTHHANGFIYQVAEVVDCLRQGRLESASITWEETLNTMKLMDEIRAQWGFRYPFE